MAEPPIRISAVVLAGGKSRRMGRDKRFLDLNGQTLLQRVLRALEPIFPEIMLVAAGRAPELAGLGHPVIQDLIPGCATLGGIYTGLASTEHAGVFVVACDMPFLNAGVIRHIVAAAETADVVMPRLATGLQPTHAVYRKGCLPHLEQMARTGRLKVQELVEDKNVVVKLLTEQELRRFDPVLLSFFNANTPADVEFARKLLSGGPAGPSGGRSA
jgi:molybdopterin-guanine dinucleotide biosynthesis protein A